MYTETSCDKIPMIVAFWFLLNEETLMGKNLPRNVSEMSILKLCASPQNNKHRNRYFSKFLITF